MRTPQRGNRHIPSLGAVRGALTGSLPMLVAPASRLFSTSSLTAVPRLRTTCPEQMRCTDLLSMALMALAGSGLQRERRDGGRGAASGGNGGTRAGRGGPSKPRPLRGPARGGAGGGPRHLREHGGQRGPGPVPVPVPVPSPGLRRRLHRAPSAARLLHGPARLRKPRPLRLPPLAAGEKRPPIPSPLPPFLASNWPTELPNRPPRRSPRGDTLTDSVAPPSLRPIGRRREALARRPPALIGRRARQYGALPNGRGGGAVRRGAALRGAGAPCRCTR